MSLWVRPRVLPEDPATAIEGPTERLCYVLETGGLADRLLLDQVCKSNGLPPPSENLTYGAQSESQRVLVLRRKRGFILRNRGKYGSARLQRLAAASEAANGEELLFIPVAIYWGQSPDKERSWLKLLFSENWDIAGRTRKFFATIAHGRSTLVRFSEPLPINSILQDGLETQRVFRKLSRILRVHFRQRRIATVGPDMSHRRTLVSNVVMSPAVRRAVRQESGDNRAVYERTLHRARKFAQEIAADVSYPTIRVLERVLSWVWNRLYDGIELNHAQRLHEVAKDRELVYVPCHRSHIDYLLLAYIIYKQGLSLPHIAAGVNLNMPIIGSILRRGGAFFLRRSFKGNRLYAAVFNAYLHEILSRGHAIEYFIEGGRSRTGRLRSPRAGMLSMTLHSYLQNPRRPLVFVPC